MLACIDWKSLDRGMKHRQIRTQAAQERLAMTGSAENSENASFPLEDSWWSGKAQRGQHR
jgi:hypothetical protein